MKPTSDSNLQEGIRGWRGRASKDWAASLAILLAIVMAIGVVVIAFAVEKVVRAPQLQEADVTGVPTAASV